MNLNAEIIFDNLKQQMPVEINGPRTDELLLDRPAFFLGNEKVIPAGHLFFALADRLPLLPEIEENVVLICVGESQRIAYYQERCCVLHIKERADFFEVANLVQEIFDRYATWNKTLLEILSHTASVQELIEQSFAIFESPLFVINSEFHVIATTGYDEVGVPYTQESSEEDSVSLPTLAQFLQLHEPSMHVREPLLLNLLDSSTLNTNLFINDSYEGCLTIDYRLRRHTASDVSLARYLARIISQALEKISSAASNERSMLKHALQDLVEGLPISPDQQRALTATRDSRFVCVRMKLESRHAKLPAGYICNELESNLEGTVAFVYKSGVIGFIEIDDGSAPGSNYEDKLKEKLVTFIHAMDMRVGVSDLFSDLLSARLYFKQASSVLACGELVCPQERYYAFQSLALTEMILNATRELPYELYYSQALQRLVKHDLHADVSYLDTLRAYLDNNLSASKTASALFIHRSTLLERISRIKRELGASLDDPDERLRILMVLKAQQINESIRSTGNRQQRETPAK